MHRGPLPDRRATFEVTQPRVTCYRVGERSARDVWWLYGARDGTEHPFARESSTLLARLRTRTSTSAGLLSGRVGYAPEPVDAPAEGNILICCSQPPNELVLDL
ncbi:hypothetical protein [Nonomuraea sp. LPB2021202275-12-8]|uniref:hypothetical protein n=1 Tax=Nonomuraea sp. LPB2021202275-12-8 TaxID=3120159 RepID=UPI00300D8AF6